VAGVAAGFAMTEGELENFAGLTADAVEYLQMTRFVNPVVALAALYGVRRLFMAIAVAGFKGRGRESRDLEAEAAKKP
jgi:hypothetical protein